MMSLMVNEKGKDLETASKQTKLPTKKPKNFLARLSAAQVMALSKAFA